MNTSILSQSYPGYQSFVDNILSKIFDGWNIFPMPEDQLDGSYSEAVTSCIKSVYKVADNTPLDASRIELYDVTVRDTVNISRARVGIRELIKRLQFPYSHAFILFHYENPEGRSWRFSYLYKEGTQTNTTNAKRYTYVFGPNCPCRTAVQRLTKLAGLKQIQDKEIKEAFSVEALSDEFFNEYKEHYADFVQYVTGKRIVEVSAKKFETVDVCAPNEEFYNAFGRDDKRVRDYVKKMMGRLVFLCFIQRKGWLNANPYYLQELFANSTRKEDFLDAVLEPMFFGLLNTKPEEREHYFQQNNWDMSLIPGATNIPYLNGGLFEADENDAPPSKFPMELFSNELSAKAKDEPKKYTYSSKKEKSEIYDYHRFRGLLDFFAAYNFTIDENDPNDAEVGVDPEMLGKIFENLLEDNKDKGAFYTPKEIVQYMCRESLIAYLQTDVESEDTKAKLRDFVTTHEAACLSADKDVVAEKLRTVKICDPAIGSGAFPMGLLNELVACREALDPNQDKAQLKKEIIQNNIYGVDIEKGAIDIARLRFWLSIVVDLEKAEPLPNFDYKFMQGNSLLEQYEGFDLSHLSTQQKSTKIVAPQKDLFGNIIDSQLSFTFTQEECVKNLSTYLNKYFQTSNHSEKESTKTLISEAVRSHILYNIDIHKKQQERFLSEAEASLQKFTTDLDDKCLTLHVEKSSPAVADIQKKIKKASKKIDECTKAIAQYDKLLAEITNPKFDVSANNQFMLWHTWFKDVFEKGGFDIVIGNPPYIDSETMVKAMPEARNAYANKFESTKGNWDIYIPFYELGLEMLNTRGKLAFITPNKWVSIGYGKKLRDLYFDNFSQVCDCSSIKVFEAGNEPLICFFDKVKTTSIRVWKAYSNNFQQVDNISKTRISKDSLGMLLSRQMDLLLKICNAECSVADFSKAENPFTTSEAYELCPLIKEASEINQPYYKLINTGTIDPFITLWGYKTTSYLKSKYTNPVVTKTDFDSAFPRRIRQSAAKIVITGMRYFEAYYDCDGNCIAGKSTIIIPQNGCNEENMIYLLAILNAKIIQFYINQSYSALGIDGGINFSVDIVNALPIPSSKAIIKKDIVECTNKLLRIKKANFLTDTSELEARIDNLVYELYGLTNAEVKIIDPEAVVNGSDDELFNA